MSIGPEIPDHVYRPFITLIEKKKFRFLGAGSFRRTWGRDNVVIKVAMNEDGLIDNRVEAAVWHKYYNQPTDLGMLLAPCHLMSNGCLMMRMVERISSYSDMPVWARDYVDNNQVGTYKDRIVAYDYALDNTERLELEKEWGIESEFFHSRWLEPRSYLRSSKASRKVA